MAGVLQSRFRSHPSILSSDTSRWRCYHKVLKAQIAEQSALPSSPPLAHLPAAAVVLSGTTPVWASACSAVSLATYSRTTFSRAVGDFALSVQH